MHEVETIDHRHESLGVGPTAGCQQEGETNIQTPIPLSTSESCRIPHQSSFFSREKAQSRHDNFTSIPLLCPHLY